MTNKPFTLSETPPSSECAAAYADPSDDSYAEAIAGPNDLAFALKFAAWVVLTLCGGLLSNSSHWYLDALGTFVMGTAFAYAYELLHQVSHGTAFANAAASRVAGTLLGLPYLVSLEAYRIIHGIHHEEVGTERNREVGTYNTTEGQGSFLRAAAFVMLPHYGTILRRFARLVARATILDEVHPAAQRKVREDYALLLAFVSAATLVAVLVPTGGSFLLRYWIIPLVLVAAPMHSLIELPEHYAVDSVADVMRNTRTVRPNALVGFLTNWNGFHVEHHGRADVRPEELHRIHERIRCRIRYLNPSYRDFFTRVFFRRATQQEKKS